jgi:Ubiquitin family
LDVNEVDTVGQVKAQIQAMEAIRSREQRLFYGQLELTEDHSSLQHYGVLPEAQLRLAIRGRGGGVVKGSKRDLLLKKVEALKNKKPPSAMTDVVMTLGCHAAERLLQRDTIPFDELLTEMTEEGLSQAIDFYRHSKIHCDKKFMEISNYTSDTMAVNKVVEYFERSLAKGREVAYNSLLIYLTSETGELKVSDLIGELLTHQRLKKAFPPASGSRAPASESALVVPEGAIADELMM